MIKTYGLTHIALAVKSAKRSFEFYRKIFGVIKVYDQNGWIQVQTPARATSLCSMKARRGSGNRAALRISVFAWSIPKKSMLR